jgi:hypothetical protein
MAPWATALPGRMVSLHPEFRSFPTAGHYELVLLADDEPIAHCRIVINQAEEET